MQLVNDDVLLTDRLAAAGARIRHAPDALVVHDLPEARLRPRYLLRRSYTQGRSDWVYLAMSIGRRGAIERQAGWLRGELGHRVREGVSHRSVLFHAACDLARAAGALTEAVRRRGSRPTPGWRT